MDVSTIHHQKDKKTYSKSQITAWIVTMAVIPRVRMMPTRVFKMQTTSCK